MHEELVNHLVSQACTGKKCDRLDMTIAADLDVKPQTKQNKIIDMEKTGFFFGSKVKVSNAVGPVGTMVSANNI